MAENENVNEPEEVSAEDVAGGQEKPAVDPPDREQAIVNEPVAESEQIAAEETSIVDAAASAAQSEDEDLEYIDEDAPPREKPAIPGLDLDVDIVREGEEALAAGRPRYSEDELD